MISSSRRSSIRTPFLLLLVGCVIGSASCSTPRRAVGLSNTSLGPLLDAMWRAHGGLDSWRRLGRVHVDLRLEGEPLDIELPPLKLEFESRDCDELLVEDGGESRRVTLATPAKEGETGALDYQLRAVRALFHLPFALAEPAGWEFRVDVFPEDEVDTSPVGFWAIPRGFPSPHVGYHVTVDPRTGQLGTVVYQIAHPWHRGRLFQVDFRRYRWIDGIRVPTEAVHREIRPDPTFVEPRASPHFDPFDPARTSWSPLPSSARSHGRGGAPPVLDEALNWTARLEGIRFEAARADAEEDAAGESPAGAGEPGAREAEVDMNRDPRD